MKKLSLESSLIDALKNEDFASLVSDTAELGVDAFLEEGALRDLPLVGTLIGLLRVGASVRGRLLTKKLVSFLSELRDLDASIRRRMIDKLERDPAFKQKVGESLILLLDRLDHMEKPKHVARAFHAYCKGRIDATQLQLMYRVIDRAFWPYLKHLRAFVRGGPNPPPYVVLQTFLDSGLAWPQEAMASTSIAPTDIAVPFLKHVLLGESR